MSNDRDASVFLAIPTYDLAIPEMALSVPFATNDKHRITVRCGHSSILTRCFNLLWYEAINTREELGLTDFAMMHADIHPQRYFIDHLVAERRRVGADILSCIIPIKDPRGVTSTGYKDAVDSYGVTRFTMKEVFKLPETFNADIACPGKIMVVNTGLWICDFTKPWVEEYVFTILDGVRKNDKGIYEVLCISEDWHFSAWAHQKGLKVWATRAIKLNHFGRFPFGNDQPWGEWEHDGPQPIVSSA